MTRRARLLALADECRLRAKLDPGARCGDLLLPAARELRNYAADVGVLNAAAMWLNANLKAGCTKDSFWGQTRVLWDACAIVEADKRELRRMARGGEMKGIYIHDSLLDY